MLAARSACIAIFGIALSAVPAPWQASRGQDAGSAAQSPPVRVTTDTPEYCGALAARIEQARQAAGRPSPPPVPTTVMDPEPNASADPVYRDEVALLIFEGRRMCDKGLVVGGIARLRRAWMLLHPRE